MDPEQPESTLEEVMRRVGDLVTSEDATERLEEQREQARRYRIWALRLPLTIERALLVGHDCHGAALRETTAERLLSDHLAKGKRIIVLQGEAGTGKSYAVARNLSSVERALWVKAADYGVLAPWDPAVDGYRYVPVLAIDDLGLEPASRRARIEELLCDRHAEDKTTLATTNLSAKEFGAAYSERVLSRLREVGAWVQCREVVRAGSPAGQQRLKLENPR